LIIRHPQMTDPAAPSTPPPQSRDHYTGGYSPIILAGLAARQASREAAFFLPHLRPGMRLLDCGCGPGAITVDLAQVVAPGEVIGIDVEAGQFEFGRKRAVERGLTNVTFTAGSVYELPFPAESFDAVFVHAVLYHLRDPERVLGEIYRVLRHGGIVGIRDADAGGDVFTPTSPLLDKAWALMAKVVAHNGGDINLGRRQRALLRQAGFSGTEASASFDHFGTPQKVQGVSMFFGHLLMQPDFTSVVEGQGWATQADLGAMSNAFREWGEQPDAFYARARCEAIGIKS
jgi:ubiquinone/menaquinone biosynthesis C-methylase UbiE